MTDSIPVMLDSSIYKQIPRLDSQLFTLLIRYARVGRFRLYISEVIEQEYLTWIKEKAQSAYNKVTEAMNSLDQYYPDNEILGFNFHSGIISSFAGSQINDILRKITENWGRYKINSNISVLPIKGTHAPIVMEAYFKGSPPFQSIKNRKDIPDAFIYSSLLDLLQENGKIVFVTSDEAFIEQLSNTEGILVFRNLSTLFEDKEICITDAYFKDEGISARINKILDFFCDEIVEAITRAINISDYISEIEKDFLDDIIGEYKYMSTEATKVELDRNQIRLINETSSLIPFKSVLQCKVDSVVSKAELMQYDNCRIERLKDKETNDEGLFEIRELHGLPVKGIISLTLSDTDPLTWKKISKKDLFGREEIKEIKATLEEIEKIT